MQVDGFSVFALEARSVLVEAGDDHVHVDGAGVESGAAGTIGSPLRRQVFFPTAKLLLNLPFLLLPDLVSLKPRLQVQINRVICVDDSLDFLSKLIPCLLLDYFYCIDDRVS